MGDAVQAERRGSGLTTYLPEPIGFHAGTPIELRRARGRAGGGGSLPGSAVVLAAGWLDPRGVTDFAKKSRYVDMFEPNALPCTSPAHGGFFKVLCTLPSCCKPHLCSNPQRKRSYRHAHEGWTGGHNHAMLLRPRNRSMAQTHDLGSSQLFIMT